MRSASGVCSVGKYGIKPNKVQIKGLEAALKLFNAPAGSVTGRIFVSAGVDPPGTPMSVFVEMGTGPKGRDNTMGENGMERYPLPPSAYTQEPWKYFGEDGQWHVSSGMKPRPYLWPAVESARPYAAEYIANGVRKAVSRGETVHDGVVHGLTSLLNAIKVQAKLFCTDSARRNAITTEVNGEATGDE